MSAETQKNGIQQFSLRKELAEFLERIKNSKLMKWGIAFNLIYIIGVSTVYLFLFTTDSLQGTIFSYDFSVFYLAGKLIVENPTALYSDPHYILPYRYLPFYAYFYILPSRLPMHAAYLLNNIFAIITNFFSTFVLYLCCKSFYEAKWEDKQYREDLFLFFMAPVQVANYILGQSSPFFLFFLLCALFFFENANSKVFEIPRENYLGGVFLGLAILFKPIALLILPFIIPIQLGENSHWYRISIKWKTLFDRSVGLSIPLIPNVLIFFQYPGLLRDFIASNFVHVLNFHHSTSFTRFASKLAELQGTPISETMLLFNLFGLFFIIAFVKFLLVRNDDSVMFIFFHESIFIVLFIYPDSWFLYFVFWWAFFVPMYNKFKARQKEIGIDIVNNKRNFILFHEIPEFCMVYFSIGVILHYVLIGLDPITPILLLMYMVIYQILSFAYIIRMRKL